MNGFMLLILLIPVPLLVVAFALLLAPDAVARLTRGWYGLFGVDYSALVKAPERMRWGLRLAGLLMLLVSVLLIVAVVVVFRTFESAMPLAGG